MSDIYFISGPITKYVQQQCSCADSSCINKTEFGEAKWNKQERYILSITTYLDVCNVCKIPYKVWYDPSNIIKVTNIGDEE